MCEYSIQRMTFVISLLFCALAWFVGGYPWVIVGFFTLAILNWRRAGVRSILVVCALALVWLLALKLTGDRRLFFPYSILFSAAAMLTRGQWLMQGVATALLFFAIRIYQDASQSVLLVEALVAAVALAPALFARRMGSPDIGKAAVVSICSAIAFFGLIF